MEAKDTRILKHKDTFTNLDMDEQTLFSFKVGKTAGVAESLMPSLKAIEASRKAGRREVVEWIHTWHRDVEDMIEWQAQLKDWDIKV